MPGRSRRTLVAALLTAAAVAVPCAAWWTAGSRAVDRERAALTTAVEAGAQRQAVHLAERLRGRLDSVLRHESQRPYFEYAYRYQDPKLSCDCASWVESPLARGSSEPLIATYFEMTRQGLLTVPSIPPDPVRLEEGLSVSDALRETERELRSAAGALARAAWGADRSDDASADAVVVAYGDETALVEPFRWVVVEIAGEPRLVAVRTVRPPDGSRLQGFVVSSSAIRSVLPTEPYESTFRPVSNAGARRGAPVVAEPLGLSDSDWEIALDVGDVRESATLQGKTLRRTFLQTFLGGSGIAALAAVFLVSLVAQSERVARDRSRFAASAAHELRTPLSGIRVYGEMLSDDLGDPAKQREYARQVASEADRLARVVSNVLGQTKLEHGQLALSPVCGDVSRAVGAALDRMRPAMETKGASLELVVDSPVPEIAFDTDALQQMLANLVDNAERYSRAAKNRHIRVRVRPSASGGVVIEVRDHGIGIAPRDRRRMFRPFGRGADPNAPSGLGLGLAMVQELARAHGGRAWHDDAPGGGSRFSIDLPGPAG